MISDAKKEEIRDAADIVEVVSDYVKLKRSGSGFIGLCPYHNEKTPSFHVSPRLGIFKCFGCGESGDVFKFIMDQGGLNFNEALRALADRFGVMAGLSDHTHGIGVAVASVAFGARVIEKHFTLRRADGGVDSAFSLEPAELKALVEETDRAWRAIGTPELGMRPVEKASSAYRRSLYIVRDVQPGDTLTPQNLRSIRPGYGLKPKHYEALIGRTVTQAAEAGTPVTWDLVGGTP